MSDLNIFQLNLSKLEMFKENTQTGLFYLNSNTNDSRIKAYLNEAKKYKPTAVYFANANNTYKPLIYIYDNTNHQYDDKKIANLHKKLWNAYKVPMFFVIEKTEIKIFNCLEKPNISNNELVKVTPLESIKITSEVLKYFKANMFDSGAFWTTRYANNFLYSNSVYESLLNELKLQRERLLKEGFLSKATTDSLFMKSILLKYMEEREVFKKEYWSNFKSGANSFIDLFSDSRYIIKLFDNLSKHFNGGIFKLSEDEERELSQASLQEFKYFLEGNKQGNQLLLWSIYSFKDLPIELISNIYELFLKSEEKSKNGIVYTPPILVDFMIDELMPIDKPQKSLSVIDPSCGSGVFLVGVYKRLIQWWMIENDWKQPTVDVAKNIIKNSIFGVDVEEGAVKLSIFSLSLALCDTLQPDAIWNELKFDNLEDSGNILNKDFFEYVDNFKKYTTKLKKLTFTSIPKILTLYDFEYQRVEFCVKSKKFDIVLGNPPFTSNSNSTYFQDLDKKEEKVRLNDKHKTIKLPDKQLALFFLEQSIKKLVKDEGYVCLVQPSAFLYSNNVLDFRKYLLKNYFCGQIVDFACLNSSLFKRKGSGADVAVSVAFFQNKKPKIEEEKLLHVTVRETFTAKEKIYFDLSHYDFHWIRYSDAINKKSIWKCNLMGGSRVRDIVERLNSYPKLGEYLHEKVKKDGWVYSEGFIVGNQKNKSDFLANIPTIQTNKFKYNGFNKEDLEDLNIHYFEASRKKELYLPPLILIKEVISNKSLPLQYCNDYSVSFRNSIIGISSPDKDRYILKQLYENLKILETLYIFFIYATSGRLGVSKATSLLKKDIDNLPYAENIDKLLISKAEEYFINDTLDYMLDYCKGKKNSPLLKKTNKNKMKEFSQVFCDTLNNIYDDFNPMDIIETESYYIAAFRYGKELLNTPIIEENISDNDLDILVKSKLGNSIYVKKVVRIYDGNIIYIIKPKEYRFWLKSIAVRDADETFSDLVKMGY